jgi:SAM-dependent methyltransferase
MAALGRRAANAARDVLRGRLHPGSCPICGPTVFQIRGPWLRDDYVCRRCASIPRQRALVKVLNDEVPGWERLRVFESSPGGVSSDYIRERAKDYTPSQLFDGVPSGTYVDGVRREDLQTLTLDDGSVDVLVTQDVAEHVVEPEKAFREVARVLAPGGVHVWTVPIHAGRATVVRAEPDGAGGVRHLMEPDYHGNPLGGRSLVVREWGDDLVAYVDGVSDVRTTRYDEDSRWHGLLGAMKDVLVSRKVAGTGG